MCVRNEIYLHDDDDDDDDYEDNQPKNEYLTKKWSYEVNVEKYKTIDIYRILDLYKVNHPCIQHAIKKLLRCGRGLKNEIQDVNEAIITLRRYKGMLWEDDIDN